MLPSNQANKLLSTSTAQIPCSQSTYTASPKRQEISDEAYKEIRHIKIKINPLQAQLKLNKRTAAVFHTSEVLEGLTESTNTDLCRRQHAQNETFPTPLCPQKMVCLDMISYYLLAANLAGGSQTESGSLRCFLPQLLSDPVGSAAACKILNVVLVSSHLIYHTLH